MKTVFWPLPKRGQERQLCSLPTKPALCSSTPQTDENDENVECHSPCNRRGVETSSRMPPKHPRAVGQDRYRPPANTRTSGGRIVCVCESVCAGVPGLVGPQSVKAAGVGHLGPRDQKSPKRIFRSLPASPFSQKGLKGQNMGQGGAQTTAA